MTQEPETRALLGIAFGGLAPIVVAAALVGLRSHVHSVNLALVLTVVVVAAATMGGRAAGAMAAVSATLSFDFFFTKPYSTLSIANQNDLETTVLLLMVGLAVGHLAWR